MNDENQPSKTQRKKQMTDLQDLGAELVELNEERLASLALPESLLDAVMEARRMTKFEARRRQLQYVGKLMRHVDSGPIRARLDSWQSVSREHIALLHRIERWRERLLAEDAAFAQFVSEYPQADAQQLRALVRNTQRERETGKPPKNYRAMFQLLREVMEKARGERDSPPSV
ncbi:MAG: ribosome biogenesis factor YjgA [Pseudomonadota bacterium]